MPECTGYAGILEEQWRDFQITAANYRGLHSIATLQLQYCATHIKSCVVYCVHSPKRL